MDTELDRLFSPESIAVVGASDLDRISGLPVKYLLDHEYPGDVYPVNPNRDELGGLTCYPSIEAVPEIPDLALVILPADLVPGAVEECFETGVENVLIVSSGFSEVDEEGATTEAELADLAAAHDANLVGPNSQGVINFPERVAASFTPALARDELLTGEVSFVTQSGAFGGALTTMLQDAEVGLNKWVATGNEADLGALDFVAEYAADEGTGLTAGYIEGFNDGRKLVELKRTEAGIDLPMVLIKVGTSERGQSAAASHTGTVAGSHAVYEGVFRETGVMAADDVDDFVALVQATTRLESLPGKRLGVVTTSGGAGVHIADVAAEKGLELPALGGETRERIEAHIPSFGSALNPVDLTGQVVNSQSAFRECLELMLSDDDFDSVVLQITNASGEHAADYAEIVADAVTGADTPLFLCWTGGVDKDRAMAIYDDAGVPVFENPARCIRSIAALDRFRESKSGLHAAADLPARPPTFAGDPDDVPSVLTETAGKELLADYGVSVPEEVLVEAPGEARDAAERIGTPLVAKLVAPDLQHRDRVGGVRTGIETVDAAVETCEDLFALGADLGVKVTGVTLQEQVPAGTELSLGITVDPDFGPVLMLGRGGVDVEAIDDVTFRTIPLVSEQAASMLADLETLTPEEFTEASREAVVDAATALSACYMDNPWIREADVNPLIVGEEGATAVDALFVGPE